MSNIEISKINIDETQLLIKDAQNRQDLASLSTEVQSISTDLTSLSTFISTNYLPLSGGSLTGGLTTSLQTVVKDNTIDTTLSPESNLWPKHFVIKDKDDIDRGYFELYQRPDTTQGIQMETKRIINNENIFNGIRLGIKEDGTRIVNISEDAIPAWQDALQMLPLSGGTLTGELTTSSHLTIKDNTLDTNSLEEMWPRHFSIKDKDDTTRGYFEIYQQPDGTQGFQIEAQRLINDHPIYNGIRLAITSAGGRLIRVTPGAESAWRNALGASNGIWPTSLGGTGGSDSGWQSVTSDVFSGTIYYRKIGHFGEIYGYGLKLKNALDNNNALQLATIDSSYKPSKGFMMPFGSSYISGVINLTGSGVINLYKDRNVSTMTTSMSFYFNYTYII